MAFFFNFETIKENTQVIEIEIDVLNHYKLVVAEKFIWYKTVTFYSSIFVLH